MAQEMGKGLGRSALLFGTLPSHASLIQEMPVFQAISPQKSPHTPNLNLSA
jgi:hypothetical protein